MTTALTPIEELNPGDIFIYPGGYRLRITTKENWNPRGTIYEKHCSPRDINAQFARLTCDYAPSEEYPTQFPPTLLPFHTGNKFGTEYEKEIPTP